MASHHVQPRERRAVGIVTDGADGIARTVHLGGKLHLTQIVAADDDAGDGSRRVDAASGFAGVEHNARINHFASIAYKNIFL